MQLANEFCDLADEMEEKRLFRLLNNLEELHLSMPNNIAEGSGSTSKKSLDSFLTSPERSTFENREYFVSFEYERLYWR